MKLLKSGQVQDVLIECTLGRALRLPSEPMPATRQPQGIAPKGFGHPSNDDDG